MREQVTVAPPTLVALFSMPSNQASSRNAIPSVSNKKSSEGGYLVKFTHDISVCVKLSPCTQGSVSP